MPVEGHACAIESVLWNGRCGPKALTLVDFSSHWTPSTSKESTDDCELVSLNPSSISNMSSVSSPYTPVDWRRLLARRLDRFDRCSSFKAPSCWPRRRESSARRVWDGAGFPNSSSWISASSRTVLSLSCTFKSSADKTSSVSLTEAASSTSAFTRGSWARAFWSESIDASGWDIIF